MTTRPATEERRRQLFLEAVELIEREHAHELELAAVARRIATSRRQLQRVFAEVGDTSFREHLTAVRMDRAVELMRHGGVPVRDVAMTVGYRQPAQFAMAFRCHVGASPSAFRRGGAPLAPGVGTVAEDDGRGSAGGHRTPPTAGALASEDGGRLAA